MVSFWAAGQRASCRPPGYNLVQTGQQCVNTMPKEKNTGAGHTVLVSAVRRMMFGLWSNQAGRPPWGVRTFEVFSVLILSPQQFLPHHFPFCTDVGPRPQDDQQPRLVGQMQKILQISTSCEVGNPLYCFVEVPGDVSERTCMDQLKSRCVDVCGGQQKADLTLGWHSGQSCTSSGAGPSSSLAEFWSSGCCLRCIEKVSHL